MAEQVVSFVGDSGVGKTTVAKFLTSAPGTFNFNKVRAVPTVISKHTGQHFRIHECGGSAHCSALRPSLYKKAKVSIICVFFALNKKDSFYSVTSKYIPEIKKAFPKAKDMPPVFLVGTKNELTASMTHIHQDTIINCVKKNNLCCYLNVSAKDGTNMKEFGEVMRQFWTDKPQGGIPKEEPKPQTKKKKGGSFLSSKGAKKGGSFSSTKSSKKETLKKPEKEKKQRKSKKFGKKGDGLKIDKSFKVEKNSPYIMKAIYDDNIDEVKNMIEEGMSMTVRTKHMNTPIHYAAAGNHLYILKELLQLPEVTADVYNVDGETPLTLASARGHSFVCQHLIESGKCNIRLPQKRGEKKEPINLAEDTDTKTAFLSQLTREEKFIESVKKQDFTSFKNYLPHVNVDCVDERGKSALEYALDNVGSEDILEKMCFRGVDITPKQWEGNLFYEGEMKRYWHRRKRKNVVYEILQDEKDYTDKLDPLMEIFVKPAVPKLLKLIPTGRRGKMKEKNKRYLMMVTQMLNALSMIHLNHKNLVKEMMRRCRNKAPPKEQAIATFIREMQIDNYFKFVMNYLPLSELTKREKELEKFKIWIEDMEKKSGFFFWKTLKEPNIRLHKFKSYLTRLVKDCCDDVSNDKILKVIYQASLDNIITQIEKIEAVSQELKGRNMIISISGQMKEKYNFKDLEDNEERSYIYHDLEVPVRHDYETEDPSKKKKKKKKAEVPGQQKTMDIFFFNDCVFVGDPLSKNLECFSFVQHKMIVEINHSSITVGFFTGGRVKPVREITFDTPLPKKWSKPIKRAYRSNPEYYSCTVMVLDHLKDIQERSRFHELKVKLRNVDRVAIREKEIEHLEDQIKVAEEEIMGMKRKIQQYKDESNKIQKDEDQKQKEKEERRRKMMEMVNLQKKIQVEQRASRKKEQERMDAEQRRLEEEMKKGRKSKKGKFTWGRRKKSKSSAAEEENKPSSSRLGNSFGRGRDGVDSLVQMMMGSDDEESPTIDRSGGGFLGKLIGVEDEEEVEGEDSSGRGGGTLADLIGMGVMGIQQKNEFKFQLPKVPRATGDADTKKDKVKPSEEGKKRSSRFEDIMKMDDSSFDVDTPASPVLMNWESSFSKEADEAQLKLEELEKELSMLEN